MDYAQARLQARFGQRPDETLWRTLERAHGFAAALEIARSSGLRRWTAAIDPASDSHAIEISLRAQWRECVGEMARWMPERWQSATLWTSRLPDLPALCHLARGEAPLPWMSLDPELRPYATADAQARDARLRQEALAFAAPLWPAAGTPATGDESFETRLRRAWLEEWRRRWPVRGEAGALEELIALVESSLEEPMQRARQDLMRRLRGLFRRSTLQPAAAFVLLAFTAIDLQRLRAELLRHRLLREAGLAS